MLRYRLRQLQHRAERLIRNPGATPHPNPLLVVGNQKSGTSAIAALLGKATEQPVLVDLFYRFGPRSLPYLRGEKPLDELLARSPHYLSRPIWKEPEFVLFGPELDRLFPDSPRVFIVRDPYANTRSILDRLGLGGDVEQVPADLAAKMRRQLPLWDPVLRGPRDGWVGESVVDTLALRWANAARQYLDAPDRYRLVRYEDFRKAKRETIESLAADLGLEVTTDITADVDRPFQKPGRPKPAAEFFGAANLDRLHTRCGELLDAFGYEPVIP